MEGALIAYCYLALKYCNKSTSKISTYALSNYLIPLELSVEIRNRGINGLQMESIITFLSFFSSRDIWTGLYTAFDLSSLENLDYLFYLTKEEQIELIRLIELTQQDSHNEANTQRN